MSLTPSRVAPPRPHEKGGPAPSIPASRPPQSLMKPPMSVAVLASPAGSGPDYASLLRRKLLSTLLAVATLAVVWLVVSPASAMAPVCDPRGAVGFAPPPQIQDAELSLDIPADCFDVNPLETKNYVPGHHGFQIDMSSQEPVAPQAVTLPALVFAERLPVLVSAEARPPPGIRASLDRPPRV